MIIDPVVTEAAQAPEENEELSSDFIGDPCELQEMATDLLAECHNVVVALARFEHHTLTEAETPEEEKKQSMVAAAKEGIGKMVERIKAFFAKLVNWVKNAVLHLYNRIVGPRVEWLKKHEAELNAATENNLKAIKVKLGEHVAGGKNYGQMGKDLKKIVKNLIAAAKANATAAENDGWRGKIDEMIAQHIGSRKGAGSLASSYKDDQIGPEKEFELSRALVQRLRTVAEDTAKNSVETLKAVRADLEAMKNVTASVNVEGKGTVDRVLHVGPKISALIGAFVSANSVINAQAMTALARAAAAGRKTSVSESTDLLARFMPA